MNNNYDLHIYNIIDINDYSHWSISEPEEWLKILQPEI